MSKINNETDEDLVCNYLNVRIIWPVCKTTAICKQPFNFWTRKKDNLYMFFGTMF